MRWTQIRVPDVKRIVDRYNIINRALVNDKTILDGLGTPITGWRNTSLTRAGLYDPLVKKCYCWDEQKSQPDRSHFLCAGTGSLGQNKTGEGAFQKYGYTDIIFTTVSDCTLSSSSITKTGSMLGNYTLSGSATNENILTERFTLNNLKDVTYFLSNDTFDGTTNRVEYYYSLDDVTYTRISIVDNPDKATDIFNKLGTLVLPAGTEFIRFKIVLKKLATAVPPKFNAIKFRYRKMENLGTIDNRFSDILIPAFLASREPVNSAVNQGEYGWTTSYPVIWWIGPELDVRNNDVVMFLKGSNYMNDRFEVKNMILYSYGEDLQVLHKNFESRYIRDNKDLLGVINYIR
jgi:hypothetical protein